MIQQLHHLNFIVRDLAKWQPAFDALLGVAGGGIEQLRERGVRLLRYRVGDLWLVLVEPTDPHGEPGRFLAEHGEGFFLASFQVDDLGQAVKQLAKRGLAVRDQGPRQGLDDWLVMDLDPRGFNGLQLQLVQETGGSPAPNQASGVDRP